MGRIQILDKITIDKIAAGEVIERPAAVVKELVENAIDAGASSITVEIKDGGISYIRITDNGSGIEKEDIPKAFLRHATSKLRTIDDLNTINSLGFRGEALSSVSSVAQVELMTKTNTAKIGSQYIIHGGNEISFEDMALNNGTSFIIKNLFYNIPARRKFLKTAITEASHVSDFITKLALSHPHISFQFISKGELKLHTTGNGSSKDLIYQVFGREIASNLLEVNVENPKISVKGYVGKPVISRGKRDYENYFINGRYVKSSIIARAIEDAYNGYTMQHRYPFTVLYFTIDMTQLDVNVHPTKMDLRFSEQNTIYNQIYEAVVDVLEQRTIVPKLELPEPKIELPVVKIQKKSEIEELKTIEKVKKIITRPHKNQNRYGSSLTETQRNENLDYFLNKMKARVDSYHNHMSSAEIDQDKQIYKFDSPVQKLKISDSVNHALQYSQPEENKITQEEISARNIDLIEETKKTIEPEQLNLFKEKIIGQDISLQYRLIGQVFSTYWMIEYEKQLYIIDQHAAHEKVLYEATINSLKNKEYTTQYLSPPMVLKLTMGEQELLKKYKSVFTDIGFEIEHFGIDTYALRGVPGNLFGIAQESLFIEILDSLSELGKGTTASNSITEKIASMSCKAAVKGNSKLSTTEVGHLINQLLGLDNPFHCPHGRPIIIAMTQKELEKKFKRIL